MENVRQNIFNRFAESCRISRAKYKVPPANYSNQHHL